MANQRGFFISFESIDGLGKTTQVKKLVQSLTDLGYNVLETKEPGDRNAGSNIGAGIRNLVFKDPTTLKMKPGVADLLFLADHIQTAGDIEDAVAAGKIAISDRYADSQWAYNASDTKKCPEWVMDLFESHFGIVPDLTILLVARGKLQSIAESEDISWALSRGKARQGDEAGKQNGKAWNNVEDQRRIQRAYLNRMSPMGRTFRIDVWEDSSIKEIAQSILSVVMSNLTFSSEQEAA